VIVSAVLCAGYAVAAVKKFADACHKDKKRVTEDIICHKDKEGKQRRKKLITSLIKVKLRRLQKDTVIISLSSTRVFTSLSFVQTYCSSS
jgi:hypothetical protein